ncbi:potassium transporter Kup [Flavobacterium macacae]|uniref:Potassium transporter Kup n=2 Tax=Flavobacterium macacae TaxID=2488993 RepID=A0A3P3W819_9FLAO|nr:potassium transporter Kup [Flavobacterium macacae]
MHSNSITFHQKITLAGSLIAVGIVFGDIGTSPLYTLNAVFHNRVISETIALGSLSCIFWTLFFQTTLKYVIIALQADNHGEGGILSLYALIKRYWGRWLLFPAMAGGAFLMADSIITPPISVASAIEGVQMVIPGFDTVPVIIAIIIGIFVFQQFGTDSIGKIFGPAMVVWFGFIAVIGFISLMGNLSVLKALNPYYGYKMLVEEPRGFWLLGSIFLCTTGAEALYSDMGHCGRNNIRVSWIFIKTALVLCYAGQTAWLMDHIGESIGTVSPFYHIVPRELFWPSLVIATVAAIIASQALISGCFTLISEAICLGLWPRHRVLFPGSIKGQLYIPAINWALMGGCLFMVLYFRESIKMEAAYGLSVTLTMIMSTVLIYCYLRVKRVPLVYVMVVTLLFACIEFSFLIANLQKIAQGGWITLGIGSTLFLIMFIWWKGQRIRAALIEFTDIAAHLPSLRKLRSDRGIPKFAPNIVFLTHSKSLHRLEKNLINSIFSYGTPKRADNYWFLHVNVLEVPYGVSYEISSIAKDCVHFVNFDLGFHEEPRIGLYFRQVVQEMVASREVVISEAGAFQYGQSTAGDFKIIIRDSFLSYDNNMPLLTDFIMKGYYNLKHLSVKEESNFGLDQSNLVVEKYPLVVTLHQGSELKRKSFATHEADI